MVCTFTFTLQAIPQLLYHVFLENILLQLWIPVRRSVSYVTDVIVSYDTVDNA